MKEIIRLDLDKAVYESWQMFKKHPINIAIMVILALTAGQLTCGLGSGAAMIAIFSALLHLMDKDTECTTVGEGLKDHFKLFVPGLVLSAIGSLGIFLCGIGVIVTVPLAIFAMLRVADNPNLAAVDAFKEVLTKVKEDNLWLGVFASMMVSCVILSLGWVVCGIGAYVVVPLSYMVLVHCYRQIFPKA